MYNDYGKCISEQGICCHGYTHTRVLCKHAHAYIVCKYWQQHVVMEANNIFKILKIFCSMYSARVCVCVCVFKVILYLIFTESVCPCISSGSHVGLGKPKTYD